jgi:hypothetical protein
MVIKEFKYPKEELSEAYYIHCLNKKWAILEIQKLLDAGFTFDDSDTDDLKFFCLVKLKYYDYDWFILLRPYYNGFYLYTYECDKVNDVENIDDFKDLRTKLDLRNNVYSCFDTTGEKYLDTYEIICEVERKIKHKDNPQTFQMFKEEQERIEKEREREQELIEHYQTQKQKAKKSFRNILKWN